MRTELKSDLLKQQELGEIEIFTADQLREYARESHEEIEKSTSADKSLGMKEVADEIRSFTPVLSYDHSLNKEILFVRKAQIKWDVPDSDDISKSRAGTYLNTPENRKKGRVGQKYGHSGSERQQGDDKDQFVEVPINEDLVGKTIYVGRTNKKMKVLSMDKNTVYVQDLSNKGPASTMVSFGKGAYDKVKIVSEQQTQSSIDTKSLSFTTLKKVVNGHKESDPDTYEKLGSIVSLIEQGNLKAATQEVNDLDTYQRELIPPDIHKKLGGKLTETGERKANMLAKQSSDKDPVKQLQSIVKEELSAILHRPVTYNFYDEGMGQNYHLIHANGDEINTVFSYFRKHKHNKKTSSDEDSYGYDPGEIAIDGARVSIVNSRNRQHNKIALSFSSDK